MPTNLELLERLIRISVGIVLLGAVFSVSGNWRWAGLVGLMPLVTGMFGWCPVYAWLTRDSRHA